MLKILKPKKPYIKSYKKIMGFDIETEGVNNNFVLGTFYSKEIKKVCKTKEEVKKFLNNNNTIRGYNIFATNLAFDFLGTLFENSNQWSVTERNGVIYSFRWYQNIEYRKDETTRLRNPINFYDTIRLYSASVETLGNILEIPKMKHPKCFGKKPKNKEQENELIDYCMNDSKISYNFIKKIVIPILKKYKIKLKSTIGSIALEDYLTNHLKQTIFQEPQYNHYMAFNAYYGGRTETYQRGVFDNVYCLDINSLYPTAMLEKFPNPNRYKQIINPSMKEIIKYEGVSRVRVHVPPFIDIPPLPYHKDGKLIFPVGEFEGFYTHIELRNVLKYGVTITKIFETLIYPKTEYFFKSFVNKHYKERLKYQKDLNPLEVLEKNILNNLYGKWAFNYLNSTSLIPAHDFDFKKHIENAKYVCPLFDNKFVSVKDATPNIPCYSFPIWSAYVTSYARIIMYPYLVELSKSKKLLSTDTDSVFVKDYNNEIPTSNELGKMKLEKGYPILKGCMVRPKNYDGAKPKCKGVRFIKPEKEGDLTEREQYNNMLNGKKLKQFRFIKFTTAIKHPEKYKINQIIEFEKQINLNDTKRVWEKPFSKEEQQTSKPININEINKVVENIFEIKQEQNVTHINTHTHEVIKT